MSCFLYTTDSDAVGKINIDDLYNNKQKRDMKQVSIFNKILNRIHNRITLTGRSRKNDQHIWFTVPEYIFGEPVYDKAECIAYLIAKLEENRFHIRYLHPNTLFVSWSNWIPSYVRNEYKKRTGISVDDQGQVIKRKDDSNEIVDDGNPDSKLLNNGSAKTGGNGQKDYTSTKQYKPTGNLVYNPDMFERIEKKIT
jgi:hypothetical protein